MAKHPVEIIRTAASEAGPAVSTDASAAPPAGTGGFARRAVCLILCCIALALTGCSKGYDPEPPAALAAPSPNISIAGLHDLFSGQAIVIQEPLVISGQVTTSDYGGNFHRTLCIEDRRAAVEILLGTDKSHNRYPVGCRLILRLEGLCIERSRGVLQVGLPAPASSGSAATYFQSQALLDEYLFRGPAEEPLQGHVLGIGELKPELCGTLVLIPGLSYRQADEGAEEGANEGMEDDRCWRGYRRFEDETGAALHTYVSPYARFAEKKLPEGTAALRGILQRIESGEHEGYILKLRDENDCLD